MILEFGIRNDQVENSVIFSVFDSIRVILLNIVSVLQITFLNDDTYC